MKTKGKIILNNILWSGLALVLLFVLWYIAALAYSKPFLLPTPTIVLRQAAQVLTEKVFWDSFFASLVRCLWSLGLSFIFAVILAIFSVLYKPLHKLLSPIVTVLRSVPTMSVIFMLILILNPKTAPIFVTFLVVMPSMYSMFISAFIAAPKELLETGRVFGFNKYDEVTKIYLPLSLPVMVESLAGGFSLSFKILIASEVLSSTAGGMGYLLTLANLNIQIPRLLAITVLSIAACILVELSLRALRDRVAKDLY